LWQYTHALHALYETPALAMGREGSAARAEAARIIERVAKFGRKLLTEPESKELLAAYGIPVVPTIIATTEQEAV
jgi:acetyltransferase